MKLSFPFFAVFMTLVFGSPRAEACGCLTQPFEEEFKESKAVFIGRLKKAPIKNKSEIEYTFAVYRTWKGDKRKEVRVFSVGSPRCDFVFEPDREYFVVAFASSGKLKVSGCSATAQVTKALEKIK